MSALAGLHILITRPSDLAEPLARRLEAMGACCSSVPVMAIEALEQAEHIAAIKARMLDFDRYQIAIFISQNAARHGLQWIDRYWPQPPSGQGYFAIGAATARLLSQSYLGEVRAAAGAMNSEALLSLPELQQVAGQRVLIFRGLGGRQTLARGLLERGAEVDYCELYRRVVPANTAAGLCASQFNQFQGVRLLTAHSGESLSNLQAQLHNNGLGGWYSIPLLVPGQRVARLAKELGFEQLLIAENASDDCVCATIQQWYSAEAPQ